MTGSDAARLVVMGRIGPPYGVKGWVNVFPFSESVEALLDHRRWLVGRDLEAGGQAREMEVLEGRVQGDHLVVQFVGCIDREQAILLKGLEVAIPRSHLPAPEAQEVYWADLVGLAVLNEKGEALGEVSEVFSNGSHPVLRVRGEDRDRLIPFVEAYVRETDVPGRSVRVDWDREW